MKKAEDKNQTELYFVTGNTSKFREASSILEDAKIKLLQESMDIPEPKTFDQKEVVIRKADEAYKKLKKPLIVDDTAIYFKAYPSFPGTFTKQMFKSLGYLGIQNLLNGTRRDAYFETLVCYKDKNKCVIFSGRWSGKIIENVSEKINKDWPYDSIFVPEKYNVTLSELAEKEREQNSHRKKALFRLKKYLLSKGGVAR